MAKVTIGGILGGIAMWFMGFIFWGTPLNRIAFTVPDDATGAAVQAVLKQQLAPFGSGAYPVPWPGTEAGTMMYGQGPVAMVMYHAGGLPVVDSASLLGGLVLAIACALLIAAALYALADRVTSFAERMRLVVLFALAATLWTDIGQPIFNHAPWGYYVYLWISDIVGLTVAGAVIARWFLPARATAVPTA